MAEPVALDLTGFQLETSDQVMRFMAVLDEINTIPRLASKVCLHGGDDQPPRISLGVVLANEALTQNGDNRPSNGGSGWPGTEINVAPESG